MADQDRRHRVQQRTAPNRHRQLPRRKADHRRRHDQGRPNGGPTWSRSSHRTAMAAHPAPANPLPTPSGVQFRLADGQRCTRRSTSGAAHLRQAEHDATTARTVYRLSTARA
jgi:hypothetical protein